MKYLKSTNPGKFELLLSLVTYFQYKYVIQMATLKHLYQHHFSLFSSWISFQEEKQVICWRNLGYGEKNCKCDESYVKCQREWQLSSLRNFTRCFYVYDEYTKATTFRHLLLWDAIRLYRNYYYTFWYFVIIISFIWLKPSQVFSSGFYKIFKKTFFTQNTTGRLPVNTVFRNITLYSS